MGNALVVPLVKAMGKRISALAEELMGVSLGFPKGCGSPVATSKCSTF